MVYMQMGVLRIFLDAADTNAFKVWTSSSLGFTKIDEATYLSLHNQYTLVHNIRQNGLQRCIKLIPSQEELWSQVLLAASMLHTSTQDCTPVCPTSMRLQSHQHAFHQYAFHYNISKRTGTLLTHPKAV